MNVVSWFKSLFSSSNGKLVIEEPEEEPKPAKKRGTTKVQQMRSDADTLWAEAHSNMKSAGLVFKSMGDLKLKNGSTEKPS